MNDYTEGQPRETTPICTCDDGGNSGSCEVHVPEKPKRESVELPPQLYDFVILVADVATNALPVTGPMGYYGLIRPTQQSLRDAIQRKDVAKLMYSSLTLGGIALALYMLANPGYTRGVKRLREEERVQKNGTQTETTEA